MEIYDDILQPEIRDKVEEIFTSYKVNWHLERKTCPGFECPIKDENMCDDVPNFHHQVFIHDRGIVSPHFQLCKDILRTFEDKSNWDVTEVLRIRSNLLLKSERETTRRYTVPHLDTWCQGDDRYDCWVLLYYITDSDGPTYFFKDNVMRHEVVGTVEPKKGRFVLFKNTRHAASLPWDHDIRVVLNYNLKLKKRNEDFRILHY